ncbi:uncharacterized protein LTR77_010497 [Saxophila tyrrhenica]|uniref:Zn(2)-C6 fungal-type domain-containing protein n=1 Tax=Saxophila tyrrhenica TaxID=1690608 RepID=A0AAV9NXJ5_9PEZI|nr:hypothetical protein LTR77_010497 [Saxophila tyrrhenica]
MSADTIRAHSKSRTGCLRCKRRKVKCDEIRPRCTACNRRDDNCVYPSPFAAGSNGNGSGTAGEDDSSRACSNLSSSRSPESGPSSALASILKSDTDLATRRTLAHSLDQHDLRLLWHYMRKVAPLDASDPLIVEIRQDDFVQEALQYPFMMEALLSMSALHLRAWRDRTADWALVAELKKSRALKGYISTLTDVTDDNVLAAFCCSTILPITFLASSAPDMAATATPPGDVVQAICTLLRLQCGIGAVMRTFKTDRLWESRVCKMMTRASQAKPTDLPTETTEALAHLRSTLKDTRHQLTDYGGIYLSAVCHLERCLALLSSNPADIDIDAEHVFGWPVLCGELYVEALVSKHPPALAILACYGVALHHLRALWFIGDWGQHIVHATSTYLDSTWKFATSWARRHVEG